MSVVPIHLKSRKDSLFDDFSLCTLLFNVIVFAAVVE
jgi:hypothetical protein